MNGKGGGGNYRIHQASPLLSRLVSQLSKHLLYCTFPNWNSLLLDLTCSTTPQYLHLKITPLFFPLVVLTTSPFPL